jgi:hypothetical protein
VPTSPPTFPQPRDVDPARLDLGAAAAAIAATARLAGSPDTGPAAGVTAGALLEALVLLHRVHDELAAIEPALIAAARHAGVSWQTLAPALGVASRQAAERRYLRLVPAAGAQKDAGTGDARVRAERDRRAGHRAVAQWANDNTADLRRLAGQITGLTNLDDDAAAAITQLHQALADTDASALPALLADARRHLHGHPGLADQISTVTNRTEQVRRDTQHDRNQAL